MSSITRNNAAITASISATGTGCAEPIAGWGNSRRLAAILLAPLLGMALGGASPAPSSPAPSSPAPSSTAELEVSIDGLRDARGMVMLCLTRRANFLDCDHDPARVTRIVPAGQAAAIDVAGLAPGGWSLLAIHDANQNGRLDTMMGIPREGFAFSRNPPMRMGPPHLDQVRFALSSGESHQALKMKYLL